VGLSQRQHGLGTARMNEALLKTSLEVGVMLRVAELIPLPAEERQVELEHNRERWTDLIASKADVLLYGGGKPGEVASVHIALVNAIAHLSFVPGGITVFGLHFETVLDPPSESAEKMPPMRGRS
jgi:hypothetical protein